MRAFQSPNPCFLAVLLLLSSAPWLPKLQARAALGDTREPACHEVSRAGSWEVCAMGMWQGTLGALPGITEVTCLALRWGTHMPSLGHGSQPPEEPIAPGQTSLRPRSLLRFPLPCNVYRSPPS